jgi:tetratricopeptide (TPR) repeat protein
MAIRVPIRLRRVAATSVIQAWLYPCTLDDLHEGDTRQLIRDLGPRLFDRSIHLYGLPIGILAVGDEPLGTPPAGWRSFQRVGSDCYLPVDAALEPALLLQELAALTQEEALLLLPNGEAHRFDSKDHLDPHQWIESSPIRRRDWRSFREIVPSIQQVEIQPTGNGESEGDSENTAEADGILEQGQPGTDPSSGEKPSGPSTISQLRNQARMGMGRMLHGLGNLFRSKGLRNRGTQMMGDAISRMPVELSQKMIERQRQLLLQLLKKFRSGKSEEALKRGLDFGNTGEATGPTGAATDLPVHNSLLFSLMNLFPNRGGGTAIWGGNDDLFNELMREYHRLAQEALAKGDYRRAAYLYGKMIGDFRSAAEALLRGGLFHEAAIIFRDKVKDLPAAARAFEQAGELDEAIKLYVKERNHVAVGDLLVRQEKIEQAHHHYQIAADRKIELESDYLGAGQLIANKIGNREQALEKFIAGWEKRDEASKITQNANQCLQEAIRIHLQQQERLPIVNLIREADPWFDHPAHQTQAIEFYQQLIQVADHSLMKDDREELIDRSKIGLVGRLTDELTQGKPTPQLVAKYFSHASKWSPSFLSDARFASRVPNLPKGEVQEYQLQTICIGSGMVLQTLAPRLAHERFVAYADGRVAIFDSQNQKTQWLKVEWYEIIGWLSCSNLGEDLVVTNPSGNAMHLQHYHRDRENFTLTSKQVVAYTPDEDSGYEILAEMKGNGAATMAVYLSTPSEIKGYSVPGLLPNWEISEISDTILIQTQEPKQGFTVWVHPGSITWGTKHLSIPWRPCNSQNFEYRWELEGEANSTLELSGLTEAGDLYHTLVDENQGRLRHRTQVSTVDEAYAACCLVRHRRIVAVTKNGMVRFLKINPTGIVEWATSRSLYIPVQIVGLHLDFEGTGLQLITTDGNMILLNLPK